MEQVPHWLEAAVFAAGMTAYAEEVDGVPVHGVAREGDSASTSSGPAGRDSSTVR